MRYYISEINLFKYCFTIAIELLAESMAMPRNNFHVAENNRQSRECVYWWALKSTYLSKCILVNNVNVMYF